MDSGGPNEHTLPHFAGRVGRGMGPPISGGLEKSFLTIVNKPYLQFGAVYGRFFGETAPLDFSSKSMDFRSKMASEVPNEHTLPHFAARVGRGMGPPISGDLEKSF